MRVAVVAPPWFAVPPRTHGGVETLLAVLVAALGTSDDDVILYTIGSSRAAAERRWLFAEEQAALLGSPQRVVVDSAHALFAYMDAAHEDVDVVHDHSGYVGPSLGAATARTPVLCTLHKPLSPLARRLYALADRSPNVFFGAISRHQCAGMMGLKVVATVHNAVDASLFPLKRERGDYLVDITRICPEKAPHRAIEIARRAGLPLRLAGRIETTPQAQRYFSEQIQPELGGEIEYVGEVRFREKVELLAGARALVFPVEWAEPFGLVVAEALACGTPVIATPRGGIPEIVRDGVEGFLAEDVEGMTAAVALVDRIDPAACRRRVEEHFSPAAMTAGYRRAYAKVVAAQRLVG